MYKIEFLHVLILCCFGIWLAREIFKKKKHSNGFGIYKDRKQEN
jgi:hypothetical protein